MGLWLSAPKDLKSYFRLCYLDDSSRHMLQLALGPHQCNNDWLLDACYHGYENLIDFPLETKHIAEFARGGQLELLKRQEKQESYLVFEAAGIGGHLDVIGYLATKYHLKCYDAILFGAAQTQHFFKVQKFLNLESYYVLMAMCRYNRVDLLRQININTYRDYYGFYNVVFHPTDDRTELLQFIYDHTNDKTVSFVNLACYASIEQIRWIEDKRVAITNDVQMDFLHIEVMCITRTCPLVREWLLLNAHKFI